MTVSSIETDNLSKRFGDKWALKDFTLAIGHGGIHALVGSNGAGKTTLFRLLLGFETPSAGSASVLGEDSTRLSSSVRGRVGFVNEEHTLPAWMTARGVTEFQRSFYPGWNQRYYDSVIGYFDVDPSQRVSALSRGERAGLDLAIAFAQCPRLLILDEPTLGLDVVARRSLLEAVMFTGGSEETTIIYCSHQMDEIERVADRLIVMEKGRLRVNSRPDEFVERISCWICEFGRTVPCDESIPGLLSRRVIDGRHHLVVVDQGLEFGSVMTEHGATSVKRNGVSLETAINAYLTRDHIRPEEAGEAA